MKENIIKIKVEINGIEKIFEKINEAKNCFLKKMNKTDFLVRLTWWGRDKGCKGRRKRKRERENKLKLLDSAIKVVIGLLTLLKNKKEL